ncbi:MAG: tetratricopeptide repeat protein [Candidatus Cloacimonadota bacterium]|nr:tetratricopeptide repeat protein [Candidatus Cloacimonadota bacterium]
MAIKNTIGIFKDGLNVKVAQLTRTKDGIKIIRLDETQLSYPFYYKRVEEYESDELPEEMTEELAEFEDEEIKIPELTEIEETDSIQEINEEEVLSGKNDLQKLLLNFQLNKSIFALNANDEQIVTQEFPPDFAKRSINKRLQKELLTKEERKKKQFSIDHIRGEDNQIRSYLHKGRFDLLSAVKDINPIISKKQFIFNHIEPNEISLLNFIRNNLELNEKEYTTFLYIGQEFKIGMIFQEDKHVKNFSIIVPETQTGNILQPIFSKILLEQDSSDIPATQNILIAGERVSDQDIEYLQENCGAESHVHRLELKNFKEHILPNDENITPEKIARYIIPISLAWRSLEPKNENFYTINLLPKKVIESQKHFRLSWHGFIVLAAIFFFTLSGTIKNMNIRQQISKKKSNSHILNAKLIKFRDQIARYNKIEAELNALSENLKVIDQVKTIRNSWHYILPTLSNYFTRYGLSWIARIQGAKGNFKIGGFTTNRKNIIEFSKMFPNCQIGNIKHIDMQDMTIWSYLMTFNYPDSIYLTPNRSVTKPPSVSKSKKTVDKTYNQLVRLYLSRDFAPAYSGLKAFIKKNPNSKFSDSAHYLMAECLYQQNEVKKAIEIFREVSQLQNNNKKTDALMMLGNCYLTQEKKAQAVQTWDKLINEFPQSRLSKIAKMKIKKLGL